MKNIFIVLAAVIITGMSAHCQQVKVSEAAKNAFAAKFPGATNVKWGKENATEYEAEFRLNNQSISANFKMDGSWVETETTINVSDLPSVVTNAIKNKYRGSIITIAEKPGSKIIYETVIRMNGKKKEIEINPDGTFVK